MSQYNEANVAAFNEPATDPKQPGQSCPYKSKFIYLIPVRYAMVETQPPPHLAVNPGYYTEAKPLGVRLPREGYLYYIHSDNPQQLIEKSINAQGKLSSSPIKLPKQGTLHAAYSEVKWSEKKRSEIINNINNCRSRYMQTFSISAFCAIGSKDMLPVKDAADIVAECQLPLPATQLDPEMSLPFEQKPFSWIHDKLACQSGGEAMSTLTDGVPPDDSALLILHDLFGILKDIDALQGKLFNERNDWYEKNKQKLNTGKFINGLYKIRGYEIADQLKENEDTKNFPPLTPAQAKKLERITQAQNQAIIKKEKLSHETYGREHKLTKRGQQLSKEIRQHQQDAQQLKAELRAELGEAHYEQVMEVTDDYREQKTAMYIDDSWFGRARIRDLVKTRELDNYMANVDTLARRLTKLEDNIIADRKVFSPKFNQLVWYFDMESSDQHKHLLENHLACITHLCTDSKGKGIKLARELYLEKIGRDNYAALFLEGYDVAVSDYNNLMGSLDSAQGAFSANNDAQELISVTDISAISPQLAQQMSRHPQLAGGILAALTPAYIDELKEAATRASGNNMYQRLNNLAINFTPGFKKTILSAAREGDFTIEYPSTASIAKAEQALDEINDLARPFRDLAKEKRLAKKRYKTATRNNNESAIALAKAELKEITDQFNEMNQRIHQRSDLISEMISPAPTNAGNCGFVIRGLTPETISEIDGHARDIRQGILNGYGVGRTQTVKGIASSIKIPLFLSLMSIATFWSTYSEVSNKPKLNSEDWLSLVADGLGVVSATTSMLMEGLRHPIQEGITSTSNPLLAEKLGKLFIGGTFTIAFFDAVGTLADLGVKSFEISKALKNKDTASAVGAAFGLVGDISVLIGNTKQLFYAYRAYRFARLTGQSFTTALSRFATPITGVWPWLLAGSLLILIGEMVYELYKRPPLMRWLASSIWGNESKGWSYQEEQQKLAETISTAEIEATTKTSQHFDKNANSPHAVYKKYSLSITIHCMGITQASFNKKATPLQLSVVAVTLPQFNNQRKLISKAGLENYTYDFIDNMDISFPNNNLMQIELNWTKEALQAYKKFPNYHYT
ncbi:toxin VasX [Spartinivicinus poritis]|uniref:Toxin VasX N-terminal region domain-containing protein n=1 Tax=Spartinivicinus poritis TaxID=2994640 RepID=A0ABT5UCV5_9GAMM|nr:toxin VasX [Spartinivicinus sp. A2-2]MDE1463831.1 hypothetical protein [Spartinivicinus sp. A2-2]